MPFKNVLGPWVLAAVIGTTTFSEFSARAEVAGAVDQLQLSLESDATCLTPGDAVTIRLEMSALTTPAVGYQAFVDYDPSRLTFVAGAYADGSPFGLPLINPVSPTDGRISLAAGIVPLSPATSGPASLAELVFEAGPNAGVTYVSFAFADPSTTVAAEGGGSVVVSLADSSPVAVSVESTSSDQDQDGVTDDCDLCTCGNDAADTDGDGFPDACDGHADLDHNGHVDLVDWDLATTCISGPGSSSYNHCAPLSTDDDDDVDLFDLADVQVVFSGDGCQ